MDENILIRYAKKNEIAKFTTEYKKDFPNATDAEIGNAINVRKIVNTKDSNISGGGVVTDFASLVRGILSSQSENLSSSYEKEFIHLQDVMNIAFEEGTNKFRGVGGIIKNALDTTFKNVLMYYEQQSNLQTEINTKAGLTGKLSEAFRKDITETTVYAARLGVSFSEVSGAMTKILTDSGRFKIMSSETMDKVVLMSKVGFDDMNQAAASVAEFQKVSRGASDAMEAVNKTVLTSLQLGLNAKETTKTLTENIGKLNTYGFKDGVEGLRKMVQQAQALKLDLNASFELANKVMDPTDALSLAANLQVIGGALGDFNDPIKMMWMATNNVEGLQDALVGSLESLVSFNEKSGTFEIVGADLRRARAMAEQFGMSIQDASNLAIQAAQRSSAAADMMSTGLVFSDEDDKEFLTNLAQMKGGKMVIELPTKELQDILGQKDVALESLTERQKNVLLGFREDFKKMDATDIAEQQVNALRNIERNINFLAARARVELGKSGTELVKALGFDPLVVVEQSKELTDKLSKVTINGFQDVNKYIKIIDDYKKEELTDKLSKVTINGFQDVNKYIKIIDDYKKEELNRKINASSSPASMSIPTQSTPATTPQPLQEVPSVAPKEISLSFSSDATMDTFKRAAYNEWVTKNPDAKSYLFG